jgi:hypothetical protein
VEPELVLINALNTWFGSVVGCESFHADVHAGNLLVLPDGRVAFIDFGIVGRIRWGDRLWHRGQDQVGGSRGLPASGAALVHKACPWWHTPCPTRRAAPAFPG